MIFKPKDIATNLVDQYRVILMNEDTDCGEEVLCSLIAIKMAKVTLKEKINEVVSFKMICDNTSYCDKRIKYLEEAIIELNNL